MGARRLTVSLALVAVPTTLPLLAQSDVGLNLERSGRYAAAAEAYHEALQEDDSDVVAWLGLERVYSRLGRLNSLVLVLDSSLVTNPENRIARQVQIRVWFSLGQPDSAGVAARRWMAREPMNVDPYRQLAESRARNGDATGAVEVLLEARSHFGGHGLTGEIARLYVSAGQFAQATFEWKAAVHAEDSRVPAALAGLRQAPAWDREGVLRILVAPPAEPVSHRLAAQLLVAWGRPLEGWTLLDAWLPGDRAKAVVVLRSFAEHARRMQTPDASRARGRAQERIAQLSAGTDAERAAIEAAQAFADAGDLEAARRVLDRFTERGRTESATGAKIATRIRVTLEAGKLHEAQREFDEWQDRLRGDDRSRLLQQLGWAWALEGDLDRAEGMLKADSSVSAFAQLGWVALFGGDLLTATEWFRRAGPYSQSRAEATRRTSVLALLQRIELDSLGELGEAFLGLARGDTTQALIQLDRASEQLPASSGRADVLAFAGELALTHGELSLAERLVRRSLAVDSVGAAAPLAEFTLAVLLARTGRQALAVQQLEHLILSHSGSAVVPEARRLLNQVQGAIPKS